MSTLHNAPQNPYGQQSQYPPGPAYPPGSYQGPPPGPRRQSHTARNVVLIISGAVAVLIAFGAISAALNGGHKTPGKAAGTAATVTTAPSSSAPPPPPTPNPAGTITGSCDVSLATSLYGQDYLTAQVNADNTGNIGTMVRVRVSWPLQGFSPITRARTVRVAAGATSQVEFHAAVSQDQVSEFQDEQLAANGSDPCHYSGTITGTWGQPTG
jgi:hypothetical protein